MSPSDYELTEQGYDPSCPTQLAGAREVLVEYDKVVDALRARVEQLEDIKQILEAGADKAFGMAKELCAERDKARARVTKLEAALERIHPHICAFGSDEELAVVDAALSQTPDAEKAEK